MIGVPKTIDGDMKNEQIEASFGFDTACKTYSELIGNICRDATSAVKYWHFVRLMGRAASHVALECALQTHPNITLISEEIQEKGTTLRGDRGLHRRRRRKRAAAGKNYGILVVPEGLPEFISDIKAMIDELSNILGKDEEYIHGLDDHSERVQYLSSQLSDHSARVYGSLPTDIQEVLLKRDSHGNVPLSQVETERLLIDLVSRQDQADEGTTARPRRSSARSRTSSATRAAAPRRRTSTPTTATRSATPPRSSCAPG